MFPGQEGGPGLSKPPDHIRIAVAVEWTIVRLHHTFNVGRQLTKQYVYLKYQSYFTKKAREAIKTQAMNNCWTRTGK